MENDNINQPESGNPNPPPSQSISPTPPKSTRNLLSLIVLILIIIIIGLGGYILGTKMQSAYAPTPSPIAISQPTPTPDLYTEANRSATANWETYTNEKYSFTFKYPESWIIETIESTQGVILSPLENKDAPVWALSIKISKQDYDSEIKAQNVTNREEVNVGGVKGLVGPYKTYPSGWTGKIIVLPLEQNALVISVQKEFEKQIDQILSTFKFTE